MNGFLRWIARIAGIVGVLLCATAVIVRLGGSYWLAGYQVGTLLLAGIAAMTLACLFFLWLLVEGSGGNR